MRIHNIIKVHIVYKIIYRYLLGSFFDYLQNQKIFSVLGYFPTISLELDNRGWVEKRDPYRPPTNYSHYLKSARKYFNNTHVCRAI